MNRGMDRSDPGVLEFYMESTLMDRRKKSHTFPQELLDLCEKEDLEEYDRQIDEEEFENEEVDELAEKRKSLVEKLLESTKGRKYNLRKRTPEEDGDDEEAMDIN